ncbi:hypothetical protein ACFOY2_39680 [Nonomuraea purpurea]|uniref:Tyr recombinase domain-containing protein n=1 Tax=Nonomuraea purpurea TaxID=1849276 RepID=A0ABV8GKK9_9ACTN
MQVVAARLGHADPAISLRGYAHAVHEQAATAADAFARAVNADGGAHRVSKIATLS